MPTSICFRSHGFAVAKDCDLTTGTGALSPMCKHGGYSRMQGNKHHSTVFENSPFVNHCGKFLQEKMCAPSSLVASSLKGDASNHWCGTPIRQLPWHSTTHTHTRLRGGVGYR
jgi:hypothetical protein